MIAWMLDEINMGEDWREQCRWRVTTLFLPACLTFLPLFSSPYVSPLPPSLSLSPHLSPCFILSISLPLFLSPPPVTSSLTLSLSPSLFLPAPPPPLYLSLPLPFPPPLSLCLSLRRFCMNARTGGVVICQSAVVSLGRTHVPVTANTSLCGTNAGQVRAPYSLCPRLTPLPFSFFSSQLFLLFFCQSMSILCLELALLLALSLSLSLSLSLFLSLPVSVLLSIVRFCVSLPFKNDNISQCSFLIGVFRSKEWLALLGGLCLCLIRNESRAYLWQVHTFPSHRLPKLSPQKS